MATSLPRSQDTQLLIRHVSSSLIVRQLQHVLKQENQPASGLKAMLQRRLVACIYIWLHVPLFSTFFLTIIIDIESLANKGDAAGVERVKTLVYRPESPAPSRASAGSPASFPPAVNGYKSPPAVPMTPGLYPVPAAAAPYAPHSPSCAPTRQLL